MTNFIIKYQDPLAAIVIGLALAALQSKATTKDELISDLEKARKIQTKRYSKLKTIYLPLSM